MGTNEPAGPSDHSKIVSIGNEKFFVAPASLSEARAAAVLPRRGSEDASKILGSIDLLQERQEELDVERDYLPSEKSEWVITATFTASPRLNPKAISSAFDKQWREKYGRFTGYGRDADSGHWTFLISADAPNHVTDLKFAWSYRETQPVAELFQARLAEVETKLLQFGQCSLQASKPPEEAVKRKDELESLKKTFDLNAIIKLQAPPRTPYDGRLVWDVLLCLGLKWGDMDCFHWNNPTDCGDQSFFSVETSTPPGYFLPEAVANGQMNPADLLFVFSVPRSAAPLRVFRAMTRAVEYCRNRLGGTISYHDGHASDLVSMERDIGKFEVLLTNAGFPPGSSDALRFF